MKFDWIVLKIELCDVMWCFKGVILFLSRNIFYSVIIISCESIKEIKSGEDWDGLCLKRSLKNVWKVV